MASNPGKRSLKHSKQNKRQKKQKLNTNNKFEGTNDEILNHDIRTLLKTRLNGNTKHEPQPGEEKSTRPKPFTEVEVTIYELSSTGEGLGFSEHSNQIFVVPFTLPGDTVVAKAIRHSDDPSYTFADFVKVLKPSPQRDESLVKCKYFATCSGCQFQMLSYPDQLAQKKKIVEKAFANFSKLLSEEIPEVGDTMPSPLQYGYRTKLTPHFDSPNGARRAGRRGERVYFENIPPIGFMKKGTRHTLDIEECPIGTASLQRGLRRERQRVVDNLSTYKRGATILLRESTVRKLDPHSAPSPVDPTDDDTAVIEEHDSHTEVKVCISDNNAVTTEYVNDRIFRNQANAFFQNNNSILPDVIKYIRDKLAPYISDPSQKESSQPRLKNLIDAYCGSGLFSVSLYPTFPLTLGIDISTESIEYAKHNAVLNRIVTQDRSGQPSPAQTASELPDIRFFAATASTIFSNPDARKMNPSETAVIIDPPRKGCDEDFLKQLLDFGPKVVVYVSCNVHTQARDVGWLLSHANQNRNEEGTVENGKEEGGGYEIKSLRGFDFFPQTGHVESICVLERKG